MKLIGNLFAILFLIMIFHSLFTDDSTPPPPKVYETNRGYTAPTAWKEYYPGAQFDAANVQTVGHNIFIVYYKVNGDHDASRVFCNNNTIAPWYGAENLWDNLYALHSKVTSPKDKALVSAICGVYH